MKYSLLNNRTLYCCNGQTLNSTTRLSIESAQKGVAGSGAHGLGTLANSYIYKSFLAPSTSSSTASPTEASSSLYLKIYVCLIRKRWLPLSLQRTDYQAKSLEPFTSFDLYHTLHTRLAEGGDIVLILRLQRIQMIP